MTIALGFLCPDGMVLCSDRQITVDGGLKYEKRKFWYMTGMFAGVRFTLVSALLVTLKPRKSCGPRSGNA